MSNCYQCQESITAPADAIHPLCDTCQDDFGYWFARELELMNNIGRK